MKKSLFNKTTTAQEEENTAHTAETDVDAELEALLKQGVAEVQKKSRKKWSKKKKIIVGAVAAVAVFFIGSSMLGGGTATMAPMVYTSPLVKTDIVQSIAINGPISGTDSVDVVSNLHVEITDIAIKEGDKVEKDQLLATLDNSDLVKEVEMAQNSYNLAVSTFNEKQREVQGAYEKALQDHNSAQAAFDRNQQLFAVGSLSQVELDVSRNAMNDSARYLDTFTIENGKAVVNDSYALQVEQAKFLLEQKQNDLDNTQVKSPIAGTVVRVNCKVGRFADKTENDRPMFIIENLDVLEMDIMVSEYSIGKVSIGQKVLITADILNGEVVNGEVTSISPTGEEKGGGSTERVVPITIRIIENNSRLIAGITARAEIMLAEAPDVFAVDSSALIQKDEGLYIASVEDSIVKLIPVTSGVENDFQIEVQPLEGHSLEEGMTIITNANASFTDGMAVTVIPSMQ